MHSEYIVYVDESGDHSLEKINPEYPVFVLAFCIFKKDDYISSIVPSLQRIKFEYFGHDMVVMHEHEIRKAKNNFDILTNKNIRECFISDINKFIDKGKFTIVSVVINKLSLKGKYKFPNNPYHIALEFGIERVWNFLHSKAKNHKHTYIIFENRGKKEDMELELEFRRVLDRNSNWGPKPFEIIMADKKVNSSGLQIADLVARPIGIKHIKPDQENRAFDIIKNKCFDNNGIVDDWGIKVFPK